MATVTVIRCDCCKAVADVPEILAVRDVAKRRRALAERRWESYPVRGLDFCPVCVATGRAQTKLWQLDRGKNPESA